MNIIQGILFKQNRRLSITIPFLILALLVHSFGLFQQPIQLYAQADCTELIINGGFESTIESGDNWQIGLSVQTAEIVNDTSLSDRQSLRLGLTVEQTNRLTQSPVFQQITIPTTSQQVLLTYWERPGGGSDMVDYRESLLLDENLNILSVLSRDDADYTQGDAQWVERTFDLTAQSGKTLYLFFNVYNDGQSSQMWNYVDDVAIRSCNSVQATPTLTPTSTPLPTSTAVPTNTATNAPISTPLPSPTITNTTTLTATMTPTMTPTMTAIGTMTTAVSSTPSVTPIISMTVTPTATTNITATTTPTATLMTPMPTSTPIPTAILSPIPAVVKVDSQLIHSAVYSLSVPVEIISLAPNSDLGAVHVEVHYDPYVLTAMPIDQTVCEGDKQFTLLFCSADTIGVFKIAALATQGISTDTLLANIIFQIVGQAGDMSPLDVVIESFTDTDGKSLLATDQDSTMTIGCQMGDVNCDAKLDVVDALFILQFVDNLRLPSSKFPLPTDTLFAPACDTDGSQSCDIVDAMFVVQCSLGISNSLCPAVENKAEVAHAPLQSQAIEATSAVTLTVGTIPVTATGFVTVPIIANLPSATLGAATLDIHYDPAIFEPITCETDPDRLFDVATCNMAFDSDNGNPDTLRFHTIAAAGISGEGLHLANLVFEVVGNVTEERPISAEIVTFVDPDGTPIEGVHIQGGEAVSDSVATPNESAPEATPSDEVVDSPSQPTVTDRVYLGAMAVTITNVVTVPVMADIPLGNLGAATLEIGYDPAVLDAVRCVANPENRFDLGTCRIEFDQDNIAPDVVKFQLLSASGITGNELHLANIVFDVVGSLEQTTALDIKVIDFVDANAAAISSVTVEDGEVPAQLDTSILNEENPSNENGDGPDNLDSAFPLYIPLIQRIE